MASIEALQNLVISKIEGGVGDEVMTFTTTDGRRFKMYHSEIWSASVEIYDVVGDLQDLIDTPILMAEEATSGKDNPSPDDPKRNYYESYTWTFYKFRTIKGSVDIRWYGSSNGYYSERVSFEEIT